MEKEQEDRIAKELTPIGECELEELYNEYLDDLFGEVDIAGFKWNTSYAFKEIDPTGYRCGMSDWLDGEDRIQEVQGEQYKQEDIDELLEDDEEIEEEEDEDKDKPEVPDIDPDGVVTKVIQ